MRLRFVGQSDDYFKHGEIYNLENVSYRPCYKNGMTAMCIWVKMAGCVDMPYSCFEAIHKNWETIEDNLPDGWHDNNYRHRKHGSELVRIILLNKGE